jgi:hypothetical protein
MVMGEEYAIGWSLRDNQPHHYYSTCNWKGLHLSKCGSVTHIMVDRKKVFEKKPIKWNKMWMNGGLGFGKVCVKGMWKACGQRENGWVEQE